jgi:lipoprotein-anchoring transpeptidase ErfK/SrfK
MSCATAFVLRLLALGLIAFSPFAGAAAAQEIAAPAPVAVPEIPVAAAPAAQPDPAPAARAEPALDSDILRPGQYRWYANGPAEGPVSILVSLAVQRAYVFRGGAMIAVSTVSSGQPGYDTPTGAFRILEKAVDHRSNLYEDAPMPFMQRLTWDGVALHAGQLLAEPASHGCIRLPRAFARRLFGLTGIGTRVVVTDQAPASREDALALLSEGAGEGARTSVASTE